MGKKMNFIILITYSTRLLLYSPTRFTKLQKMFTTNVMSKVLMFPIVDSDDAARRIHTIGDSYGHPVIMRSVSGDAQICGLLNGSDIGRSAMYCVKHYQELTKYEFTVLYYSDTVYVDKFLFEDRVVVIESYHGISTFGNAVHVSTRYFEPDWKQDIDHVDEEMIKGKPVRYVSLL